MHRFNLTNEFLKKHTNSFDKNLLNSLEKSGVIEYSFLTLNMYKTEIRESLQLKFPNKNQQITTFLDYLNLGELHAEKVI